LLLPSFAAASSVQINATCVYGTCPPGPSDALQMNQSVSPTAGTYMLTIGTDQYQIDWTLSASYDSGGTKVSVNPTATYIGALPSTSDDLITFTFYQDFYDARSGIWNGSYTENVPLLLSATAAPGSTIQAELFYDNQGLGTVGPFGPGSYYESHTKLLSGLADGTLSAKFVFNFDFKPGTTKNSLGTSPSTPTPEPAQMLPLGMAFLGGAYKLVTRRRKQIS